MEFLDLLPPQMRDPVLFAVPFFLLLLIISNSGYSIKTAALFWFILGTANHMAALVPSPQQPRSETSDLSRQPA